MSDAKAEPPAPLRQRQTARVREELRQAFVRLALERGVNSFSMQDVADDAGVSHRTLYRYYPSREALIDDVLASAQQRVEDAKHSAHAADDIRRGHPDAVTSAFAAFQQHADLVRAAARLREAGAPHEHHDSRTEHVRRSLEEAGVDPAALDALTVLIRMLTGADGWIRMTAPENALDSRDAGLAAHWAAQVLIREAVGRSGPLRPTFENESPR